MKPPVCAAETFTVKIVCENSDAMWFLDNELDENLYRKIQEERISLRVLLL